MVDKNKLRGVIAENNMSQTSVAKALKMSPKTFYRKMQKGIFGSDEIETMMDLLDIDDPMAVFFVRNK